jgi:hypothetical protein
MFHKANKMSMSNMPLIEEVKKWGGAELLEWIKQKEPGLLSEEEDAQKFKNARINGPVFLRNASDRKFFSKCGLPYGISDSLAYWGAEITGVKRKFLLCTSPRRLIMSQVTAIGRPTLPL